MPDPKFIATIVAKGQRYTAWESVMVQRDFGNGISVFRFAAAEAAASSIPLTRGDPVQIFLGQEKVIDGYVKSRAGGYDGQSHELVLAGRSKTCDLKDSSVVIQPGTYDGNTLEQAVRAVMQPHPVDLVMMNPPPEASQPFKYLAVQVGETCAEFISRIAAMRGCFITDDENGNLVLGQGDASGAVVANLVEGQNIKSCSFTLSEPDSRIFEMSSQLPGSDDNNPSRANAAKLDTGTGRPNQYRLSMAEHPEDAEGLVPRVNHEVVNTLWTYIQVSITVVGWFRPDGQLWKPAPFGPQNVSVVSPMIFGDETPQTLGLQGVIYGQDSTNGTTTVLNLVHKDMLTSAPTSGISDAGGGQPQTATPEQPH